MDTVLKVNNTVHQLAGTNDVYAMHIMCSTSCTLSFFDHKPKQLLLLLTMNYVQLTAIIFVRTKHTNNTDNKAIKAT